MVDSMYKTDALIQNPSFLNGMAKSIDIFSRFTDYNYTAEGQNPDMVALTNDWSVVLNDLNEVFLDHVENNEHTKQ